MEYPYKQIGNTLSPIIPIKIGYGAVLYDLHALIDSGSTLSLFKSDVAQILGIHYKSGKPVMVSTVQSSFLVYVHTLHVQVESKKIVCQIGFSDAFQGCVNLLDRMGFFDHFLITFDERHKRVVLKECL